MMWVEVEHSIMSFSSILYYSTKARSGSPCLISSHFSHYSPSLESSVWSGEQSYVHRNQSSPSICAFTFLKRESHRGHCQLSIYSSLEESFPFILLITSITISIIYSDRKKESSIALNPHDHITLEVTTILITLIIFIISLPTTITLGANQGKMSSCVL